ncbi:GntR family transcriptional regulator [Streptomyces sp. NPDC001816]|uniref:GntR family transcriptional regulator n=1 Tax=Streptomyces sp. NPDC001816 TaxID=3364612 RepID=UPI00367C5D21
MQGLLARIGDGAYPSGSLLPPQRVLAEDFEVSRDTVQRALRELRDLGYVDARQGSGVRVVLRPGRNGDRAARRPPALGPYVADAFTSLHVTIDVFTPTGESLSSQLRVTAERLRLGEVRPVSVGIRLLQPRLGGDLRLPMPLEDPEDRRPVYRLSQIRAMHTLGWT